MKYEFFPLITGILRDKKKQKKKNTDLARIQTWVFRILKNMTHELKME